MIQRQLSPLERLPACSIWNSARAIRLCTNDRQGLSLLRQCAYVGFNGGEAELHGIAFAQHRREVAPADIDWKTVNFSGVPESSKFVPADRQHNVVATNLAAKNARCSRISHCAWPMNTFINCTPHRKRGKGHRGVAGNVIDSALLCGALLRQLLTAKHLDSRSLGFFESGPAGTKGRQVDLHSAVMVNVNGQQTPLSRASSPDVGGVSATRNRQRDAMKRLWCLSSCHWYCRIYSRPESAFRSQAPQVQRAEALSMERL